MTTPDDANRRVIPSRSRSWAKLAAQRLQRMGARPNQVSMASVVFAAIAAICLAIAGGTDGGTRIAMLLLAAASIPLRLLCNMLDGMLAVEGNLRTPTGELFNELPDRVADLLIIAGAGYGARHIAWAPDLGWATATAAILTAYVRTLGVSAGTLNHFTGIMAKPRRMHVLIAACLIAVVETVAGWPESVVLTAALAVILIGSLVTIVQRLRRIAADLEAT